MGSTAAANGSKASTATPSHELDAPPWLRVDEVLAARETA